MARLWLVLAIRASVTARTTNGEGNRLQVIPHFDLGDSGPWAFWALVFAATAVGFTWAVHRARGEDIPAAASLTLWVISSGFLASHLLHLVTDDRETLRESPFSILLFWQGMSSLGGIFGGLAAAFVVAHPRGLGRDVLLRYLDCVAFVFPFAWILGRLGCAILHDHPGLPTDHWLAVRFSEGPRWDLGLLELLLTLGIAAAFAVLDRRPRLSGFYLGLLLMVYGSARFALDFLRIADARYGGWTAAQYLALLAAASGAFILVSMRRSRG